MNASQYQFKFTFYLENVHPFTLLSDSLVYMEGSEAVLCCGFEDFMTEPLVKATTIVKT